MLLFGMETEGKKTNRLSQFDDVGDPWSQIPTLGYLVVTDDAFMGTYSFGEALDWGFKVDIPSGVTDTARFKAGRHPWRSHEN